jgi:putative endonuclease
MPFVYMVECADGTLYTGWTTDLARRVRVHNAGRGGRYTRQRRPVRLVYAEPQPDRGAAMRRERALKRLNTPGKRRLIPHSPISLADALPGPHPAGIG